MLIDKGPKWDTTGGSSFLETPIKNTNKLGHQVK